jgi:hypothetical protein
MHIPCYLHLQPSSAQERRHYSPLLLASLLHRLTDQRNEPPDSYRLEFTNRLIPYSVLLSSRRKLTRLIISTMGLWTPTAIAAPEDYGIPLEGDH